jgi:hypothetical protein
MSEGSVLGGGSEEYAGGEILCEVKDAAEVL